MSVLKDLLQLYLPIICTNKYANTSEVKSQRNSRKTIEYMQPGSCYLGIQLTKYLLIALEFVTHYKTSTCCLEVKFIDYLLTSLEFLTHHNLRSLWWLSDGFWTTREEPPSLPWLQVKKFFGCRRFVKNFQKVGDLAYPLQKICSVYCSQKGKAPTVLDTIVMSGLETSNVE